MQQEANDLYVFYLKIGVSPQDPKRHLDLAFHKGLLLCSSYTKILLLIFGDIKIYIDVFENFLYIIKG